MARYRRMTLSQAKEKARSLGLPLHEDYHALHTDDLMRLDDLMRKTNWNQSPSAEARGHSRRHSFFNALGRK